MGICPVCSEGSPPVPAGSRTHCRGARHVPICVPMHRSRPAALEFPPERHLGYAVQWLALALATLVVFVALSLERAPAPESTRP